MSNSFYNIIQTYNWTNIENKINEITEIDIKNVISKSKENILLDENDMLSLVSPLAAKYLEEMAIISKQKTQRRFGKTIQLYIPLYLSNYCSNNCLYCGFNTHNNIKRLALTNDEILQEISTIKQMGYKHILLVTGENSKKAGIDYILNAIKIVKPYFASVSAEIQPLEVTDYEKLINEGLNTIYVYQETYHYMRYNIYHTTGNKSNFKYRLETPDRLGKANIYKIGLGALLGLENWRVEAFFMALHLRYLQKKYWRTKYSLSFPRIRPHQGDFLPSYPINDAELAQLILAFRLFDEDVEMSLTTRENIKFRNNMLSLGITSMSAGSKTEPGGYATYINELEQFAINDDRSPNELINTIKQQGYSVIWKDWDVFM